MEQLSKLDAAKRHLDFAIESYFMGEDIVPICAVVGAAHIIAHDLVEVRTPGASWASIGSAEAGIELREVLFALRKIPNWLKHARDDPEAILEFSEAELEMLLFHTVLDLGELATDGELHSDEVSVFQMWFVSKFRALFGDPAYGAIRESALESFPNLDGLAHKQQLESGLAVLMEMRSDA